MAHGRDSTVDRDTLEQALRALRGRHRALVDHVAYGIYRASADGTLIDANQALVRMLGYESRASLLAVCSERALYLDEADADRVREAGAEAGWLETRYKRADGMPVNVRVSVLPTGDAPAGELGEVEVLAEDVTERQRHDELMRRTERMATLGTTLAGVAHELNNPLAAIMGFAQLLLRKPWPDDERAALETINHEAIRSAKIVKDLLALARTREVERRGPMHLNDVAGYILRTRRYALETYGITCELRLDPSIPPVRGDRTQLEQVVLNLVANAEYALRSTLDAPLDAGEQPSTARIIVRTRRDDGAVLLEVEDNGPGIPEHVQRRIWDPFWTTKEGTDGIGLGLSVVDHIVADHGGTIHVENVAPHGARFVVRLPALPHTKVAHDLRGGVSEGQAARPLDVLVVDAEPRNLSFLTRFLTSRGHAVLAANDGQRALQLAERMSFDAVICDSELSHAGGDSVAVDLRRARGCASARFVISTPAPGGEATQRLVAAIPFPVDFVAKPYDVEALRHLIEDD